MYQRTNEMATINLTPIEKGEKEMRMTKQYQALIYSDGSMTSSGYSTLRANDFEVCGFDTANECDAFAVYHVVHDILNCYESDTFDLWRDLTADCMANEIDIANDIREGDVFAAYVYDVTDERFLHQSPKGFAFPIPGETGVTIRLDINDLARIDTVAYDEKRGGKESIRYTFNYETHGMDSYQF